MANIIKPKRTNTAGNTPTTSNLASGELGVNMADQKTYINNGTAVVQIGAGKLVGLGDVNITSPTNSQALIYDSVTGKWINGAGGGGGAGTVTSVAATVPSFLSVTGSPITTSGTLAIAYSGTALPVVNGGTGQTSFTDGQLLIGNTTGNTLAKATLTAGSGISITNGNGSISIAATNSGTVTSVTGTSPVVSSGGATPAISLASGYGDTQNPYASKTANYVLAAPNGSAGVPTFRAIVAADIPTLNQNTTGTASNVTGTVAIANGGTGAITAPAALTALGAYPATNPSGYTSNTGTVTSVGGTGTVNGLTLTGAVTTSGNLTLGGTLSGIANTALTNSAITINGTSTSLGGSISVGTVTSVTGTAPVVSSGGATPAISMAQATASVNGYLSSTDFTTFNNKANSGANTNITSVALTTGTVSTTPSAATDIANKDYVDTVAQGLDPKASCVAATTANITLSAPQTIDGIALVAGNRCLVKNQTAQADNGIYVVAAGAWTRATDMNLWAEVPGAFTFIEQGTTLADTGWVCTSNAGGTLGTTAITFVQFAGVGQYTAGTGLTLTGTQFSITNTGTAGSYGSASSVPVITTNAQGQVTAVTNTAIAIAGSAVSGNITGNAANVTGTVAILNGGSGTTTAQGAMNTFAGAVTSGSYLRGNGTNVVMSAIQAADVPTLNQNTTGTAANVTGTVAVLNGGTGATTAPNARTNLGATTVGGNFFTLTNPTAITFPRINADNTVSALDAATFRTAIGAGTSSTTGTVTSVGGTGTVSGLTLSGTVTTTGNLTLGGTLAVTPTNFASQTANTFLAAPNGAAGAPTFRTIVAADVPTLNQNTTGTAANVTGTVAVLNGGTGATTAPNARTNLGATTVGGNFFTLTNPTAITFPRMNADNTVSALDAATFRTAIGAGTSSTTGTVTSVGGTGTVSGLTLTGTVTTSGNLTLGGTLAVANSSTTATNLNTASAIVARDGSGNFSAGTITATLSGNATTASSSPLLSALGNYVWSASTLPTGYSQGIQASFVQSGNGWQNYGSVMTMNTYSGGGGALQMYVPYSPTYGGTGMQVRFGNYDVSSGNSWTSWKTLLASDNYNSYAPTLTGTGASGTWGISVTGNAATATTATNVAGGSAGNVHYQTGVGATGFVTNGTAGQVLTSNGASAPTWQSAGGGSVSSGQVFFMANIN